MRMRLKVLPMIERDSLHINDHILRRTLLLVLIIFLDGRAVFVVGPGCGSGLEDDSNHGC